MAFCSNCGTQIKPEMKFCDNCGIPVRGAVPEQNTEQRVPAQPQETYTPPVQQAQGSYTPPAQQAQGSYTPPAPQPQGGYTPPAQPQYVAQVAYAAPQAAPKQKKPLNKKLLLFGGIGIAAILIVVLIVSLSGGKAGDKNASSDPNLGVWKVEYAEMWGFETDIKDIFEKGFTIELLDKGKCKLNIDGTEGNGKWTLKDGVLTIKGGGLDSSGSLKDDVLTLEDVLGTGLKLTFRKEGAQAGIGSTNNGFPAISGNADLNAGFQSPTASIELDSYWYGTAILSNFTPVNRAAEVEGDYDVWGYIGADDNGRAYFEVFDEPEMSNEPLLSMYIDLYSDSFAADIGDEDGWLIGSYLDSSANVFFSPALDNGALPIGYHFAETNTSYDFSLFLREDGAPWDEENDPLPPGYDDYKAGLNGSAAQDGDGEAPLAPAELLSAAELRKAYDAMDPSGMTYEEVRDLYLNGVDGEREERDNPDIQAYVWRAAEGPEKCMYVSFKKNAAGKYVYTSRSINNIPS